MEEQTKPKYDVHHHFCSCCFKAFRTTTKGYTLYCLGIPDQERQGHEPVRMSYLGVNEEGQENANMLFELRKRFQINPYPQSHVTEKHGFSIKTSKGREIIFAKSLMQLEKENQHTTKEKEKEFQNGTNNGLQILPEIEATGSTSTATVQEQ